MILKEKLDNLHYDFRPIDGYGKDFNIVISPREPGKTSMFWLKKIYIPFLKENMLSLTLLSSALCPLECLDYGQNENSANKIACAVNQIKRKSVDYPRNRHLEIISNQERLCRRIKRSIQETVPCTKCNVDYIFCSFRQSLGHKHNSSPKNCPDIQIWQPPHTEAII